MMDRIEIYRGDITRLAVDAIVNAANSTLLGGGGVDGAIHRAAGPELDEECRKLDGCPTGEVRLTGGYRLPAKYIIHTVGPVWYGGLNNEATLLKFCYIRSLDLAVSINCRTLAFPNISTGVYGYPKGEAAEIAIATVAEWLNTHKDFEKVIFVVFDEENYSIYNDKLHEV
jgi:O-acetyl-ADP-ribose deacetylase (regulator of RNase III)